MLTYRRQQSTIIASNHLQKPIQLVNEKNTTQIQTEDKNEHNFGLVFVLCFYSEIQETFY